MLEEKMFAESIARQIKEYLSPDYKDMECRVVEKTVCNDIKIVGVYFKPLVENLGYTVCIESYYEDVKEGRAFGEVLKEIAEKVEGSREVEDTLNKLHVENFQKMEPYLNVSLINTKSNRRIFPWIPHMEIEDLSAICHIEVPYKDSKFDTKVTNKMLQSWGVSKEALFNIAFKKVRESDNYVIQDLFSDMQRIIDKKTGSEKQPDSLQETPSNEFQTYFLSNRDHIYGATAMLCPRMMEKVGKMYESGFYIVPMSIHQVMVTPKEGGMGAELLGYMLRDINRHSDEKETILSDRIYEYDENRRTICQVSESIEIERGMER